MEPLERAARRLDAALARLEIAVEHKLAREAHGRGAHAPAAAPDDRHQLIAALAQAERERAGLIDANRAAADRLDATIGRLRRLLADEPSA